MIFIRGKYQNHIYGNEFQEKFENGGLEQHVDSPRLEKGLQGGAFWSAFYVCPTGSNTTDFSDERYSSSTSNYNGFKAPNTKSNSRESNA